MSSYKSEVVDWSSQPSTRSAENVLLLTSGALLLLPILKKRSALRFATAAAGSALICRGMKSASESTRSHGRESRRGVEHIVQSITIGKDSSELFALWRNPDAMTRIIQPFADVTFVGPNHLRWSASLPVGALEAEAVMVEERPDELVHWQTVPESNLRIDEYMRFRPAPQGLGTEATLTYDIDFSRLPAGPVMRAMASFFEAAPRSVVRKLLQNLKSLAETGEIPTLDRNPSGRRSKGDNRGDAV